MLTTIVMATKTNQKAYTRFNPVFQKRRRPGAQCAYCAPYIGNHMDSILSKCEYFKKKKQTKEKIAKNIKIKEPSRPR